MSDFYDIIIRPVLTEKSTRMSEDNKHVFHVQFDANKPKIKQAVESIFGVDVVKVNTMIVPGKPKRVGMHQGRKSAWKKAIVKIEEGQMIDLYALESTEPVGEV